MTELLGHTYAGAGGKRTIRDIQDGYVYWHRPGKPVRRSPMGRFLKWLKASGALKSQETTT